jgi:transmembrane sensor
MRGPSAPNSGGGEDPPPVVTREIAAEAAVWIARLHGPSRSSRMERECLEWQARSAAHRLAFERCTDTWEDIPALTLGDAFASAASQRSMPRSAVWDLRTNGRRWGLALMAGAIVMCGAVLAHLYLNAGVYSTGVGEQQFVVLDDGTRLSLNTGSRVRVRFEASQRGVDVEGGEALFEVAKDRSRPFVVRANGNEVVAVGTVFSVRYEPGRNPGGDTLAVTLLEGQVQLHSAQRGLPAGVDSSHALTMKPGERVRVTGTFAGVDSRGVQVDRPRLDSVVAWKRSEAVFDDVSLSDAVAELNRYSRTPIVLVDDASLGKLRVSGVYRIGDTASFAHAVATLHHLRVQERPGRLELAATQ